jgi:DNA polymerase-1
MLRLACCPTAERGVSIVTPIHDAVMVEGPAESIGEIVARIQEAMAGASEIILDGFRFRSDAKFVRWPNRHMDDRGRDFWGRVMALFPASAACGGSSKPLARQDDPLCSV